jgi:hypothetical protein
MFAITHSAAQRVPKPSRTRIEQIASEISAKIRLGTGPTCSGLGKCCDIWAKFVGFSHPCFRKRLKPNQTRKHRSPQSAAKGDAALEISGIAIVSG